jgi:hypothetical protein
VANYWKLRFISLCVAAAMFICGDVIAETIIYVYKIEADKLLNAFTSIDFGTKENKVEMLILSVS